ncbi:MAG: hypothetical protein QXO19_03920, partial [Candidatus Aenigmatarchaeota archaeon]
VTNENGKDVVLGAGDYEYVCNVSETENYTYASVSKSAIIHKADTSIKLYLNGNEWTNDISVTYPFDVDVNGVINVSSLQSEVKLYRNGNLVSNPFNGRLSAGTYEFVASFSGNENYSASSSNTRKLTIEKNTTEIFLEITPNETSYGNSIKASCYSTNPEASIKLYRNGIDVTNENGKDVVLGAGDYEYVCNVSETENYTYASVSKSAIIHKAKPDLILMLNGIKSNITITEGNIVNITAILENINITPDINLYINDNLIKTEKSPLIYYYDTFDKIGIQKIVANISETENYTDEQKVLYVNVIKDTNPPVINSISITPNPATEGINVIISANITDETKVEKVILDIPSLNITNILMFYDNSSKLYYTNITAPSPGGYLITINATDIRNNSALGTATLTVNPSIIYIGGGGGGEGGGTPLSASFRLTAPSSINVVAGETTEFRAIITNTGPIKITNIIISAEITDGISVLLSPTNIKEILPNESSKINVIIKIPENIRTKTHRLIIKAATAEKVSAMTITDISIVENISSINTTNICFDWSDCLDGKQSRICQTCINENCTNITETRDCSVVTSSITGALISSITSLPGLLLLIAIIVSIIIIWKRKSLMNLFKKKEEGKKIINFETKYENK